MIIYVSFTDETQVKIGIVFGGPQNIEYWPFYAEIEDDDPRYLEWLNPTPTPEELSAAARLERDTRLKTIYDPGINMALRAVRMASTPEELSYAESKTTTLKHLKAFRSSLDSLKQSYGQPPRQSERLMTIIKTKKYEIQIKPRPDNKPARVARDGPIGLPTPPTFPAGSGS